MANWSVGVYDSISEAEIAIELIDSATTTIRIFGFMQGSHQKTVVLTGDITCDATEAKQDTIIADVSRNVSMMEFWSAVDDIITLTTATSDVTLPNIVVADIPAGATITRVVGMIRMRALNNTNASVNAINGAGIVKIKETAGAYVNLITIGDNIWSVAASTKEGGMLLEGDIDASAEVDANDTYNLRFDGNIFVDGNNLELIDVAVGLKVYFTA